MTDLSSLPPPEKRFPIQGETRAVGWGPHARLVHNDPFTVPWHVAEAAYTIYAKLYPQSARDQSLERLAQRGGFGPRELLHLLSGGIDDRLL